MEENEVIKIVVVGDFLIFRSGLKLLLECEESFTVVGEAADLHEALTVVNGSQPDIFLVDAAAIDNGNLDAFRSSLPNETPILVLTNSKQSELQQKYLELGINGIFSKEKKAEALFKAIRQVSTGDLWFQRKMMVAAIQQLVKEKKSLPEKLFSYNCEGLTSREREVLTLICKGMKNKAIADSLFITETTVRHHLTSIFEKLKVNSRLELVVHAFNEKLVEIPSGNGNGFGSENAFPG
ncbi:MAG TPA: response regulator transcription factor [Pyrinomonadaceae bacterium]